MKEQWIEVDDKMQQNYAYLLVEPVGRNFHPEFCPELTPKQMLELGVFGGKYMTDCTREFPADWFENAKLCTDRHDPKLNFFGVNASQPLSVWRKKDGSSNTIRGAGSSGTAVISWAAARLTTFDRSAVGVAFAGTSVK